MVERPATRTPRWHSLDVLKGLALWAMIAHHLQEWTGGEVDGRFVGFDHFAVTDLAPPLFAVSLGAAAVVVGDRAETWSAMRRPSWRWAQIFVVGLAIDLVVHEGVISGRGVLPTLAILGLSITLAVAIGARQRWIWWAVAGGYAALAVPATAVAGDDPLHLLVNGPFSLPVYGVLAASGAAVAAHGLGRTERALPLVRAALGVLCVGLVTATLGRGVVAPEGVWPPARYPGHLGFTLWGVVASLLIWAAARQGLGPERALGRAIARAGRRTLLVFAAHFVVEVALRQAGLIGQLDTWRWGIVTWFAVAAVCAVTTIRSPRHAVPLISSRDRTSGEPTVPVVRSWVRGAARPGPAEAVLQGGLPPGRLHRPPAKRRARHERDRAHRHARRTRRSAGSAVRARGRRRGRRARPRCCRQPAGSPRRPRLAPGRSTPALWTDPNLT